MILHNGKVFFISVGASGIGREVALRFHAEGWIVGVYDIDATALEKLSRDYPDIIIGELDAIDQSPEIIKKQCDINCTGVMWSTGHTSVPVTHTRRAPGEHGFRGSTLRPTTYRAVLRVRP